MGPPGRPDQAVIGAVVLAHNRPYTSTDNPYTEAQFKTLKYRPAFPPASTASSTPAPSAAILRLLQPHHRHSGIGLMTPATVHHGHAEALHADRAHVLDAAYAAKPERFVRHPPTPPPCPPPPGSTSPTPRRPLTKFDARPSHPT